ncbi:MAG TPA: hypothetical protein VNB86_08515 [Gaiellaceae bacterium]|nr:hypothetical protein [Gaiellaceae bacterium]
MLDDRLRSPTLLLPVGAALAFLAAQTAVFARETERPPAPVFVLFALAAVLGLTIGPLWLALVPIALVVGALVWSGAVEEDVPVVALVGGLLVGIAVARAYATAVPVPDAPARRWSHAKRLLRPVVSRATFEAVDDLLDRLRFRIDTLPNGLYQPVPGLPIRAARATGSESRWRAMRPVVERLGVRSAVDIGACEGYFALELGALGIPAIAVESEPSNYRTALFAARRRRSRNVGVLALEVTPANAFTLPPADCVLCLSVWHHFVRANGFTIATEMLGQIWAQTRRVLFFDTGEAEMTPDYGLPPMTPDARAWLTAYLAETCPGGRVEHLGAHRAFAPGGEPCERNLFAVVRS